MNALHDPLALYDAAPADLAQALPAKPATVPAASPAPQPRDLVAGLEKGLAVIAAFDQERTRLTISEVAQRCKLTRAAARRYLITLEHLGFVSSDRKMYALTAKVLRLGQGYMHSSRLPRIVQPELLKLANALREASAAGVLDGPDVLCIAATSAGRMVSHTLQPGTRAPAYCTANGRVLLAALPPAELDAWLDRETLTPLTPHTLTDVDQLRGVIEQARVQGHACVDQEFEPGLRTIAVPLKNYRGEVVAALNISAHASRMPMGQLACSFLPALLHAQAQLRGLL